jgi:hypothetical protein
LPCRAGAVWCRANDGPPGPDVPGPLYTINGLAPSKGDNVILRWDAWFKARS